MTLSKAERGRRASVSLAGDFALSCITLALTAAAVAWPDPRYRDKPVEFAREVLGIEKLWSFQIELLEAIRDHKRVAVASGHKVAKSFTAAVVALWWFCSYEDARVVLTAPTARQVDKILWREIRKMHARARIPIGGEPGGLARTGLVAPDLREIVGFTAKEAEGVAGVSGANLLYIPDEASGVPQEIFEAIEGNRAGGARLLLLGNPTRNEGEHFDAFFGKSEFYKTIRVSSESTPNAITGKDVIPGLATREWIEEKRREWGEDSALWKIRVKGEHALSEDGKIISVALLVDAEERWDDAEAVGRLCIGIDPAGPGDEGDETAFASRRGFKVTKLRTWRGLNEDAIVAQLVGVIAEDAELGEVPLVVVDSLGEVGSKVARKLRAYLEDHPGAFELVTVRGSDRATREPAVYHLRRDELWANMTRWLREGGAIPSDTKLSAELHAPDWVTNLAGKLKASDKRELRRALGRSPDRADACCLAVWEPTAHAPDNGGSDGPPPEENTSLDPYAGDLGSGQEIDPYGAV